MTTQTRLLKVRRFGASGVAVHLWSGVVQLAGGAARSVAGGLERLAWARSGAEVRTTTHAAAMVSDDTLVASELFAQAVRENSNLELDWLWLATRVSSAAEQRYCYQQALAINPDCEWARRALSSI